MATLKSTSNGRRVLISGAGIAGTTLAYWLLKGGFQVTIVERARDIRDSGHAVEVSSPAAKRIVKAMGIDRAIHEKGTTEKGLKFVNDKGKVISRMDMDKVYGRSFTSEDEILRGDLAQILYKLVENTVDFRFDDYITDIKQDADAVDLVFNSGKKESFDHLIICDGLHSKARSLAGFNQETVEILPFRLATAFFTIENRIIDLQDKYAKWYTTHGARHMMLRPDATGKNTRGYFTFSTDKPLDRKLSIAQQKELVTQKFSGCAYVVDQVLESMNKSAPDFYMTDIAQVKAKTWTKGRIALCGDAAYCPSPLSGAGVDCAMTGAYVLAGELSKRSNYREAFEAYQRDFKPFVDEAQGISPSAIQLVYPHSHWGLAILRAILWLVWASGFIAIMQKVPEIPFLVSKPYQTPDYDDLWE